MSILSLDFFRPALILDPKIVAREEKFDLEDPNRKAWRRANVYLSTGGIEQLRAEPNYKAVPKDKIIHYLGGRRPRRVYAASERETAEEIAGRLKEAIFFRGCNAGIYFNVYRKGVLHVAEAVPIIIEGEV
jgi:hypothetical protein